MRSNHPLLRRTLDNGLTILTHRNAAAPVVAVQVWVQVGSADETPGEFGLAHVHEHMLFKGTETRAVGAIAAEVEASGGDINAFTSYDQTVYHVVMSSRFFDRGLDVLADAVQRSTFEPDELGRELEVVLEEIKRSEDSAPRVAAKLLFETAFQSHPYGRPVIGTTDSVRAFTREGILEFYRRWYVANNLVVVCVGDLDEEEASQQVAAAFAELGGGQSPPPRAPEPPQTSLRFSRKETHFQQVHLNVGWRAPAIAHEDVPALDLLALIMGQGESSRLVQRIKRQRALANDVGLFSYTPRDAGLIMLSANLPVGDARDALHECLVEVFAAREGLCSPEELAKAQTIVESQLTYERESVAGMARKFGFYQSVAGGWEAEETYHRRVRAATPERLREVARKYLTTEGMTVSCVVPEGGDDQLSLATVRSVAEGALLASAGNTEEPLPAVRTTGERIIRHRLDSGMELVLLRDSSVPLVAMRAAALAGTSVEPLALGGIGRLTHVAMNRGTRSYTAAEFARAAESTAAHVSAAGGRSSGSVRLESLKAHLDTSWQLFCETILHPRLDEQQFDRERSLQLELLRSVADRPASLAVRELLAALFGGHSYGASVLGTPESVGTITRESLVAFHQGVWRPERMVLAAVGDFDPEDIVGRAEAVFGSSSLPVSTLQEPGPVPAPQYNEIRLGAKGEQAHIAIGMRGMPYKSEDRAALDLLITVLAGQGGRLFLELRDKQSLAYSVTASSFEGFDFGYVLAYMGTSPEKVGQGLDGLRKALTQIANAPITASELERAQRYVVGTYDVGLQRRGARAGTLAYSLLFESPMLEFDAYTDRVLATTADDVLGLASRLIDLDKATVCILEPDQEAG